MQQPRTANLSFSFHVFLFLLNSALFVAIKALYINNEEMHMKIYEKKNEIDMFLSA